MDDEGISSGLSSLALYEIGRLDGEVQRRHDNAVSAFSARLRGPGPVDVDAVLAENQLLRQNSDALWQDNQELRQLLVVLQHQIQRQLSDNQFLRQSDDALWRENQGLKQQVAELEREVQRQYHNKCEWLYYSKTVAAERNALLAGREPHEDSLPW